MRYVPAGLFLTLLLIEAADLQQKRILHDNMTEKYNILPKRVDTLNTILSEGEVYGRLRVNSFVFNWDVEVAGKRKDHYTVGVGGSVLYKSAYFNGFGFTVGAYTSQNPLHMDDEDAIYYKVGKGVLNRYHVLNNGEYGISSLAQLYGEYKNNHVSIRLGRQIFESVMTKSNDIKMIPNTFEGLTLESEAFQGLKIKAGYLIKQKLRDHSRFHHLFAYDDGEGRYDSYRQNDDAAMHKGITLGKLKALGIKDRLMVLDVSSVQTGYTTWSMGYSMVPDLFSSFQVEYVHYWEHNGYRIAPGVRYLHQFDLGAGRIGGPSLKTNALGYHNKTSLDANLYAARVDVSKDDWGLRFGMTHISDDADVISPWRAFPTGGFAHALLQYNWYANTTTFMVEGKYDFDSIGLTTLVRYAIQDFDDKKPGVQADSHVFQVDLLKMFRKIPGLYTRVRMVDVRGEGDTTAMNGRLKMDPSYQEIRFELNYLF